ncbi:hypothetical protein [Sphingobium fuliginis]|uniref:Uncharacterized protein n=1 Tax=Sphingobium fuliginis (strain ATCC 27551) TaxID=336203 RepID=A0A292YW45_SPHSA|nr:hypothetical protein [Sphingobium fuliginis]GAY19722.1 hypothetical protein SFOMI_0242 [Sphingobium fuliginis]
MSAKIFGRDCWRAAQGRRAEREAAIIRQLYARPAPRKHRSLDEIMGPAFDPTGGAA